MKINLILVFVLAIILSACVDDKSTGDATTTATDPATEETKTTFLREPVDIVPSTGEDYPQSLQDIDFPILPNAEVTSVGNTDIENGTVVMQLETLASITQIQNYYRKAMPAKQWHEKKLKVFQGADNALSFRNKDYSARIMLIDDKIQDFRKLAITLNKRVKLEEF